MKTLQLSKVYRTIIALFLTVGLLLAPVQSNPTFSDSGEISVYVNGKKLDFDVPPLVIKERTLVPLRKIFEELGAQVIWNAKTPDKIVARNNAVEVEMQLGKYDCYINKKHFKLDVAPVAVNGRTLIPARAVSEAFGCKVGWDQSTMSVLITTADYAGNQGGNNEGDHHGNGSNHVGIRDGKRIVTSFDPNNYIVATIEGNKVFLEGRLAYDDYDEVWVKLHYGNGYDESMPESQEMMNDRYEKEASDFNWGYSYGLYPLGKDKTFDMEVNLKNTKINRLLIYGINRENKFPGDDDSTKDYVAIYDSYFFIEKNGNDFRFLPVREYEHNLKVMRTLKNPTKYLDTSYMTPEVKSALKKLSDRIVAGAKTDREKLLKIHDWMTEKLVYNKDFVDGKGENFNTPVDIIQKGTSQCYGFTILFTDLARLQGIPTTKAIGYIRYEPYHKSFEKFDEYGPNFNLHSWNVCYVDGKWIHIDVTWDIQSEIKNRVIQWKKAEHSYFDINLELFSHDHLLDYFREKHEWGYEEDDIDL